MFICKNEMESTENEMPVCKTEMLSSITVMIILEKEMLFYKKSWRVPPQIAQIILVAQAKHKNSRFIAIYTIKSYIMA